MLNLAPRQRAILEEMGIPLPPLARKADSAAAALEKSVAAPAPVAKSATAGHRAMTPGPAPERDIAPLPAEKIVPLAPVAPPRAAIDASERTAAIGRMDWPALKAAVNECVSCQLCHSRTHTVFGVGSEQADWMIIGEAPGENEDKQGEPFVGQAGKLLDRMLAALQLSRQPAPDRRHAIYIANVLKCRPPRNRNPEPEEMALCEPFLKRQIALVQPKVILAMGRFAVQTLLGTHEPIGRLRGHTHHYEGVPTVVTYHPAYLLRNPGDKGKSWADLCLAASLLPPAGVDPGKPA